MAEGESPLKNLLSVVNACVVVGVGGIVVSGLSMLDPYFAVKAKGATISSRLRWIRQKQQQAIPLTDGERLLIEQVREQPELDERGE